MAFKEESKRERNGLIADEIGARNPFSAACLVHEVNRTVQAVA